MLQKYLNFILSIVLMENKEWKIVWIYQIFWQPINTLNNIKFRAITKVFIAGLNKGNDGRLEESIIKEKAWLISANVKKPEDLCRVKKREKKNDNKNIFI